MVTLACFNQTALSYTTQLLISLNRGPESKNMNFEKEKKLLKAKYASQREWMQSTPTYGCWIYPCDYYNELVELIKKHRKQSRKAL